MTANGDANKDSNTMEMEDKKEQKGEVNLTLTDMFFLVKLHTFIAVCFNKCKGTHPLSKMINNMKKICFVHCISQKHCLYVK